MTTDNRYVQSRREVLRSSAVLGALSLSPWVLAACGPDLQAAGSDSQAADPPSSRTPTPTGSSEQLGGETLERLRDQGFLKIAMANEPPYTELKADGTVTGMVPELVKLVMKDLGVPTVNGEITSYDSMIPGLQAKQWDVVAAGLAQTPERCEQVLFSDPDTVSEEALFVEEGNPMNLHSYADVARNKDAKIPMLTGSAQEETALKRGITPDQFVLIPDVPSALEALKSGRANALITIPESVEGAGGIPPGFERVKDFKDPVKFGTGIAFREEDKAFRDAFNEVFRAKKQDGSFVELSDRYGFDGELAIATTNEELDPACAD